MITRFSRTALGTIVLASLIGCGSPVVQGQAPPQRGTQSSTEARTNAAFAQAAEPPPVNGTAASTHGASASGDGGVNTDRPPPLPLTDSDFTESDRTRDPFRSFAQEFVPVGPSVPLDEHVIKLRDVALDQLQLIAVILGTDNPYAMVTEQGGNGTIIRRGDYVGRPETIAGGDGLMPHQVPWRVSRIVGSRVTRDSDNNLTEIPGEVVFEREDRLNPNAARAEHVLTLTPGAQANRPPDTSSAAQPTLPNLPGFAPGASPFLPANIATGGAGQGVPGANPPGYVQSYTQIVPGQPAQQSPPTTVLIQTGPNGEMSVASPGQQGAAAGGTQAQANAPVGPRDPYGPPPGGSNQPPRVQLSDGPTNPDPGLPLAGLAH